jgi:hypothetical protein
MYIAGPLYIDILDAAPGKLLQCTEASFGQVAWVDPPSPWTQMTQAAYDALSVKDPNTLYVIVG